MADSLLDFGNITKLAQQNLQNAMHMQQLSLQEEQGQRAAQQLKINQQNATTEHINALGNFLKDENVKFDPNLTGAIVNKISSLAGGPAVNMDSIQVGRQAKIDYAHGIMTGNLELADQGLKGYAVAATPDQLDNLIKTTVQYPKLNEELLALRQKREEDASKFEALQENNARVAIGRPLYTAMSSSLRDQMKVTDSKDFRVMESLYDKAKNSGGNVAELLGSKSIPGVDKKNLSSLLNGNFGEMARRVGDRLDTLTESIQQDQKMLDDADHGVPLPKDMTKAILRARIETNSVARGAMTSMKEWYEEPFDKQKRAAAMGAARTIEDQRLKIEDLDKNTHADTIKIQQETLAFHQKQQQDKDEQASAEAMAKAAYSALPAKRQTPQEAEKIYQSVFEKTGRHVDTDTIMKGAKDPNAPSSTATVNNYMDRGLSTKATERIDTGANKAEAAVKSIGTVNRMMDAISKENVNIGPGANVQQYLGQIATKISAGGKSLDERLQNTRVVIQGLADMVLANRHQMQGQGQISNYESQLAERAAIPGEINTFSIPELKALLAVADRSARFEYGLHENRMKLLREDSSESIRKEAKFFEAPPLPKSRFQEAPQEGTSPPAKAQPQGGATLKSLPKESKQIGTYGGKPVYQSPDGKKWIGE